MYLVGEYGQSPTLHLRRTVTLALSQASSPTGTPDYVLLLQIVLHAFAKSTGMTSGGAVQKRTQRTKNLTAPPDPALMQWQSGERIERITKAQ